MEYMLDTDICSYIIKKKPVIVLDYIRTVPQSKLCVSVITYSELCYGVQRSRSIKNLAPVQDFLRMLESIPWDNNAANHYADIRCELEKKGAMIGNMDMLIAAHARSLNMAVVTNNEKHFNKVPGLRVENWAKKSEKAS